MDQSARKFVITYTLTLMCIAIIITIFEVTLIWQVFITLTCFSTVIITTPTKKLAVKDKAVLITGCDRGIGHVLAKQLDRKGFYVFAGCLKNRGQGSKDLVDGSSSRLQTLQLDVSKLTQVKSALHTVEQQLHSKGIQLWGIVNNAGICYIGNVEIMTEEDIQKIMTINYTGPVNICKHFLPLLRRSRGRLVNVASNAGLAPIPLMGAYCASKSALVTISEVWRYELKMWGIKVATIIPSGYKTGIMSYDMIATGNRWWNKASPIVKKDYGQECFYIKFKQKRPRLKSWMDSIRTQYGKLTKRPSGSGGRLSDRDKWILEKLSFLSKHICRISNRGGADLIARIRDKHPERIIASQENDDDEEYEDDRVDSISPSSSSETCKEPDMTKKKSANKENTCTCVFPQRLEERIQQSTEMKEKILDQIAEPADPTVAERRQWTQWFGTAISEIDDSLWADFQAESLQLVNSFKARSKRVQQANNLQQYQHSDFDTARRLQTSNYTSCPGGYLPIWQHQYQSPPPSAMLPIPTTNMSRSYSAPLSVQVHHLPPVPVLMLQTLPVPQTNLRQLHVQVQILVVRRSLLGI